MSARSPGPRPPDIDPSDPEFERRLYEKLYALDKNQLIELVRDHAWDSFILLFLEEIRTEYERDWLAARVALPLGWRPRTRSKPSASTLGHPCRTSM